MERDCNTVKTYAEQSNMSGKLRSSDEVPDIGKQLGKLDHYLILNFYE